MFKPNDNDVILGDWIKLNTLISDKLYTRLEHVFRNFTWFEKSWLRAIRVMSGWQVIQKLWSHDRYRYTNLCLCVKISEILKEVNMVNEL